MSRTRSRARRPADLGLSDEVAWYLKSRKIPLPDCPPRFATPSPGEVPGAVFDPVRVDRVLTSFHQLRHTKGKWAGRPLDPDPWQIAYILAPTFGWLRTDEEGELVRVVRTLYVEVPRKNGKSTLLGGIGIYLTCADGEPGAEGAVAATTREQAGYVFNPLKQLARSSPALKPHVKPLASRIVHPATSSYIQPVSSVAEAMHGANLHAGIIDELHVHKTPDLVEAIESGTGSRRQPLVAIITTADDGRTDTIYARKRNYVEQLAARVITDTTWLGVVWCADVEDDPYSAETQRKANPGYGISPRADYLEAAANKARQSPAELAAYQRLHLGVRASQDVEFLDLARWDANAGLVDESSLANRVCYGGVDLASVSDLSASVFVFPDDVGAEVLFRFWTPEANLARLNRVTAGQASVWVRHGFLTVTPGDVTDYEFIKKSMRADLDRFDVRTIGYDPWNATQVMVDLSGEGAPVEPVRQGFASMNSPTKELGRMVVEGTAKRPVLRHGGNPVARWMASNLRVETDANGNVKPSKKRSPEKIDGMVALIIAIDGWLRNRAAEYDPLASFY